MQSWLRTHAALVVPLMAIGVLAANRGSGATWSEAAQHAQAFKAGFAAVHALGNIVRPAMFGALARLPGFLLTALLWGMSRSKMLRDLGRLGATEPRMLIDQISAAVPEQASALRAIRP
jgi:2-dehydropantoate 2-reductase